MRIPLGASFALAALLAGCLYSPVGLNTDDRLYPRVGTNGRVTLSFPALEGAQQARFVVPDTPKVVAVTATAKDGLFTAELVFPSPAPGSTEAPLSGFFPVEIEVDGQLAGNLAVFNAGPVAAAARSAPSPAAAQRRSAPRRAAP